MIVPVRLNEGVNLEDYERWVRESYAPAVRELPSVSDWRNHRVTCMLGSDAKRPHDYVVTLGVADLAGPGDDMAGERMQALISGLHEYAGVTRLAAERFA